jgi:hypothetical protein
MLATHVGAFVYLSAGPFLYHRNFRGIIHILDQFNRQAIRLDVSDFLSELQQVALALLDKVGQ